MTRLLRNIRLGMKFGILAVLALVLISIPTTLYVQSTEQTIAQKRLEIAGLPLEHQVFKALQATQRHRGAAGILLAGNGGDASVLTASGEQADAALRQIVEALGRPGPAHQVADSWRGIAEDWKTLREKLRQRSISVQESFDLHTRLIARLLEANESMVDAFGLSLDSNTASFRLAMITLVNLPALSEELGKTRAVGASILARGDATPADLVRLVNLAERSQERAAMVKTAIGKLGAEHPEIGNTLGAAFVDAQRTADKALDIVQTRIIKTSPIDLPAGEYFGVMTQAIDTALKVGDSSIDTLEQVLESQASALRTRQLGMLGTLSLLLVVGVCVAIAVVFSVTAPINAAVTLANRVAQGDLSAQVDASGTDECARLMQALNDMNQKLGYLVRNVRNGTESVHAASQQIAAGNMDLSSRTEQQASSLEQTAASMAQLTETVKQNADNADHANLLAQGARQVTDTGSHAVREMVITIERINQSSLKVTEITGLIEGIAFQTNILALNAAVEAARAGEQGKGFAVVAGEVRTLAQRAAAAAREIKDVIATSSASVQQGTRQIAEVESIMGQTGEAIVKVSELLAEIRTASHEQSQGIEQVHAAISQIDAVTQQNAALVEESASAAQMLEEQASSIQGSMTYFTVT